MSIHTIKLPDVGEGVAQAELGDWFVNIGDRVSEDDLLGSVVTDKAAVEIPAPVAGRVSWLAGQPGDLLAVGADYVRIETDMAGADEAPSTAMQVNEPALAPPAQTHDKSAEQRPIQHPVEQPAKQQPGAATQAPTAERALASPAVRRRAREMAIDLRYVHGRGPGGRITHEDLDQYIAADGAQDDARAASEHARPDTSVRETKIIGVRRLIAQRMQKAKSRIPHFTYVEEVDMTRLEELRAQLNSQKRDDQPKLTLMPFLMRAMVKAIHEYPMMNARFDDDNELLREFGGVHIGIAVQTPNGLMVPVATHVETFDIWQCASEVQRLANAARDGSISRDELKDSTITITSLGALGGIVTTPVINYPEVAIIAVNKLVTRPVYREERLVPRQMMNLSSSFDHRVIDGWDAAQFMQQIKGLLEFPTTIFMET